MSSIIEDLKKRLEEAKENLANARADFEASKRVAGLLLPGAIKSLLGQVSYYEELVREIEEALARAEREKRIDEERERAEIARAQEEERNAKRGTKLRWFKEFLNLVEECNGKHPADPNGKMWQVGWSDSWRHDSSHNGTWTDVAFLYVGCTSMKSSSEVARVLNELDSVLNGIPCPFVGLDGKTLGT